MDNKNRIDRLFRKLDSLGRNALVAYVAAGDPDFDSSIKVVDSLVEGGIDILELGIPFSDPLADGIVNQLAAQRALDSGMTPTKVLQLIRVVRGKYPDLPIVIYTYLNLVACARVFRDFCNEAVECGADALLLLDLLPDDGKEYKKVADECGIGLVSLVAPTTPESRLETICSFATGFIYYVSQEGVTGERNEFASGVAEQVKAIKSHTDLPVVVGFGISKPEHVKAAVSSGVDGVVVGSAIVKRVESYAKNEGTVDDIKQFVSTLSSAL